LSELLLDMRGLRVEIPLAAGTLQAVRGIDLSVARGETVCLVGESGCGKSLTALAIMDLLPARARRSAEALLFKGEDLAAATHRRMNELRGDRIVMVFQEPMTALNPCWTIGVQLEEVLRRHRRVSRQEARERAVFLLEKVGIQGAARRLAQYPHQLSGGLRQRVMIAMALMCGPDLVVADEPTTALDVTIQAQILLLLRQLQREFEMGLLLITHDLGIVARIADRVAVMYAGKIVETGTAAEVFASPRHPYTRGLLACVPVPGKTPRDQPLGSIPGTVPSLVGGIEGCAFRDRCPEAMALCARPGPEPVELGPGRLVQCLRAA
jgi:peptide/nickel transport system ATP-binding protein